MMIDLDIDMAACAAAVERGLEALLTDTSIRGAPAPVRLLAAMRHGTLGGGKRLRPLLLRQSAQIFGIAPDQSLPAQLAIELVHCYSLVHDDLPAMDDDDLRRGKPTVHKAFDEATAILAGDALLTLAFGLLAEAATIAPAIRIRLVAELAAGAGAAGMVGGQMRDLAAETGAPAEDDIAQMQAMKTGALIRAAVRMGAVLGSAGDEAVTALTAYAEAAGKAFQLADDLLDVTATAADLGKAVRKDAGRGKATLVATLGVDAARRRLGDLVHDAISALTMFGPEADRLRATARYFATRER